MPNQEIKIRALHISDNEVHFLIELTNGISSISIDFYGGTEELGNFAKGLCSFPLSIDSEVKYELGKQGDNWAYYILLRAFCYAPNGHSAIQIKIDNNKAAPYKNSSEFYIVTVPASLNKLGQLLKNWNLNNENEIKWTAE